MRKIYLLLSLVIATVGAAQTINIPDANFKARLIALGVDTNSNGSIEQSEALAVTSLNISQNAISSMEGIQYFTNLTYLDCSWNYSVSHLNIGGLTGLTYLDCTRDGLYTIDVSDLTNLEELYLNSNELTSLDVANLTNLTKFDFGANQLNTVAFENLTQLTYLNCALNHLPEINLANLTNLTKLYASNNNNTTLDVGMLVNLKFLYCSDSAIATLNLTPLTQLEQLYCDNTNVSTVDLNHMPNLEILNIGSPSLQTLDLNALSHLKSLTLYAGQFTNVDLSNLTQLESLDVGAQSHLASVDVSASPNFNSIRLFGTTTVNYINIRTGHSLYTIHLSDASNLMNVCCNPEDVDRVNFELSFTNTAAIHNANSNCLFFPQGEHNTITGTVFFDNDGNGCDAGDGVQLGVRLNIANGSNQGSAFTDAEGNYNFYPQAGTFVLTPAIENLSFFHFSPASVTVPFANNNSNTSTQNFCFTNNGVHNDLEIVIVPFTPARPGFNATYKLVYKNKGNQVLSGDILFSYPEPLADYISASQQPDAFGLGSVSWNYSNLLPFETRSLLVTLNLNGPMETPPVDVGDFMGFTAVINPVSQDELPFDNEFALRQVIVGSIDPNEKTCLEGNNIDPAKIGSYLHYQINFENSGTAAAERVVVKDAIDTTKFDVSSLQLVSASHPVETRITGNNIEFRFDNINLGVQEHGNVVFKIKTKSNLTVGSAVSNKADIFFDYNFPVATNTATSVFQLLKTDDFAIDRSVTIHPNPTADFANIQAKGKIQSVQVFDVAGRIVETKLIGASQAKLDLSKYNKGIYFLKIITDSGQKTEKLIHN